MHDMMPCDLVCFQKELRDLLGKGVHLLSTLPTLFTIQGIICMQSELKMNIRNSYDIYNFCVKHEYFHFETIHVWIDYSALQKNLVILPISLINWPFLSEGFEP